MSTKHRRRKHVEIQVTEADKAKSCQEPANWKEVWEAIETMRAARDAPVDSIGCANLADMEGDQVTFRFQVLLGLMLSSQTKDEMTARAMGRLKKHFADKPGGLTASNLAAEPEAKVRELINCVGFHNRKASYLVRTASILAKTYHGDIPKSVTELCTLPGVGSKMSHLVMQEAWGEIVGIGVDLHVHRIANRLGWTGGQETTNPEDTRLSLEAWLPRDRWTHINKLLVGFGQQRCSARAPKCSDCLASQLCPFGQITLRTGRVTEEEEAKESVVRKKEKKRKTEAPTAGQSDAGKQKTARTKRVECTVQKGKIGEADGTER
eukprot:g33256.t1